MAAILAQADFDSSLKTLNNPCAHFRSYLVYLLSDIVLELRNCCWLVSVNMIFAVSPKEKVQGA